MSEISMYPTSDLIEELKKRDLSFILAWCDHQQFSKHKSFENDIVWGCDSGGTLALQETLRRFLNEWMDKIIQDRTEPGRDENAPGEF